jgi:catechol 2,3-dioxygenase-like lactoylglutathione lyase family enzyme
MTIEYNPANFVISVNVSDYERSKAWYCDVLGFTVSYELADYAWCELDTPFGLTIGIGQSEEVTPGSVVATFGVRDIDGAIAHLRSHDVKVEDWHEIAGMVRLSTVYDPDGAAWMLAQTLDDKRMRGTG